MKKILLFLIIVLFINVESTKANTQNQPSSTPIESMEDSTRLAELDRYWDKLAQTVKEGDFEGYKALYHSDAVVVFAVGENKNSVSIAKALAGWKQGFKNTKDGKQSDKVAFRFSQRIGDENTAHETGMFHFTSLDSNGKEKANSFIHFEMLLVKTDNSWYGLMEYQKSQGSKKEWDALK